MKKIGISISYQLIDIFNIIENRELTLNQKKALVKKYQQSLTQDSENSFDLGNGNYYLFGKVNKLDYDKLVKIKNHVDRNIDSFTCEGEMKMNSIITGYNKENHSIEYNFKYADIVYDYAKKHGKNMRVHTFVWHLHQPKALDDYIEDNMGISMEEYSNKNYDEFIKKRRELTLKFLDDYMKNIINRYPDCYCWDVINEIVNSVDKCNENSELDGNLRKSKWNEYIGKDSEGNDFYIEILKLARKNLPQGTKIFYNEYDEFYDVKRNAIINVINNIKEYEKNHIDEFPKGLLDGVGLQSHCDINTSLEKMKQTYKEFYETGKEVQITEADVAGPPCKKIDELWSEMFKSVDMYNIQNFTSWGVSDDLSWKENARATLIDDRGNLKNVAKKLFNQHKLGKKNSKEITKENELENKIQNVNIFNELLEDVCTEDEIINNFDKRNKKMKKKAL